ncbi:MAG: type II toxin-antitoxin system PemK/MazF family toxin [Trueperaceae bacterium]|nr:type II toxin-antitoxin system PemK/MazF family toxin [Trueperaceae bacterium]
MAAVLRGEVRWADLSPARGSEQDGRRPVLVISHDVFNERSGTVIAVALTSQEPRAGFPLTLESRAPGLPRRSWVKVSQVRTLAVERVGDLIGKAMPEEVDLVVEGLNEIVGG